MAPTLARLCQHVSRSNSGEGKSIFPSSLIIATSGRNHRGYASSSGLGVHKPKALQ